MIIEKLNKVMRIVIIVAILFIAVESLILKYGDCDKCKFEVKGKTYDAARFMQLYQDKCLNYNKKWVMPQLPTINNISIVP